MNPIIYTLLGMVALIAYIMHNVRREARQCEHARIVAEKESREAERREAIRKKLVQAEIEQIVSSAAPKRKRGRPRKNPLPEQRPAIIPPVAVADSKADSAPKAPDNTPTTPDNMPTAPDNTPTATVNTPKAPDNTPTAPDNTPTATVNTPTAPDNTPTAPAAPVITIQGNNAFVGQTVAFTGTLPGMKRAEAIEAVRKNGGRASADMTAGTTLLVVGDRPGAEKLRKADDWQSCRKIPAIEFFVMLNQPLTFEPDAFASFVLSQPALNK